MGPVAAASSAFRHHECVRCGRLDETPAPRTVSACCSAPLASTYDLDRAASLLPKPGSGGVQGLWRYRAVLPLAAGDEPVTLGEGGTPLVPIERWGRSRGLSHVWLKDESANPTGSFKDRGLAIAMSLARAAHATGVVLPTAGNAGVSAAAYGRRAGLAVSIHAPSETPSEILAEIRARGVSLTLHAGSIRDAGHAATEEQKRTGALSIATFREPGRVEGKKTMAYELREQLGRAPDAIVYPCGGGTGIVAMAKAFDEMEQLGWIGAERPHLFAAQAAGCDPIVRAFERGAASAEPCVDPRTVAAGLRVPGAFADREILDALRRTGGGAVAVTDDELLDAGLALAREEGILPCPEGAAALAALVRLRDDGSIRGEETVVVFQTATALKYLDVWASALRR
jgi:threonine synthase